MVRIHAGVAARMLAELGAQSYAVRGAVGFLVGRDDRTVADDIGLTPRPTESSISPTTPLANSITPSTCS